MSDLISRQAAIDKFEPWLKVKGYSEGERNMLKVVLFELQLLPSAQPEPQWIPCSEMPPEEEDMYKRPQNRYICQMNQAGIFLVLARLRHLGSPMMQKKR